MTVVAIAFLWSERNWEYFQLRYFLPMLFVFMGWRCCRRPCAGRAR